MPAQNLKGGLYCHLAQASLTQSQVYWDAVCDAQCCPTAQPEQAVHQPYLSDTFLHCSHCSPYSACHSEEASCACIALPITVLLGLSDEVSWTPSGGRAMGSSTCLLPVLPGGPGPVAGTRATVTNNHLLWQGRQRVADGSQGHKPAQGVTHGT